MRAFVAVTDKDWYQFLAGRPDLDEVNFWQPGGNRVFRTLKPGEPLLFKLHYPDNASWEPDAMVMDRAAGVFADPSRVHRIEHEGRFFRSRGPLNVVRSPQAARQSSRRARRPRGGRSRRGTRTRSSRSSRTSQARRRTTTTSSAAP